MSRGFTPSKAVVDFPFTKTAESSTGALELKGYASTWALDRDNEVVDPQAFHGLGEYLSTNPILLWQHDPGKPIGQVKSASTDQNGLHVVSYVPRPDEGEERWAHTAYSKIKKGIVRTYSIGGVFKKRPEKGGVRRIIGLDLHEISVVSVPANPGSFFEAAVKAAAGPMRPELPSLAVSQMEQIIGTKDMSDPDLLMMNDGELVERYEELAELYRDGGRIPPELDAWRQLTRKLAELDPPNPLRYGPEIIEVTRLVKGLKRTRSLSSHNEDQIRGGVRALRDGADAILGVLAVLESDGKALASAGFPEGLKKKEDEDGETPPNLREAEGDERCGSCKHFDGDCGLYDYPVGASDVCDSFAEDEGGEKLFNRNQPRDAEGRWVEILGGEGAAEVADKIRSLEPPEKLHPRAMEAYDSTKKRAARELSRNGPDGMKDWIKQHRKNPTITVMGVSGPSAGPETMEGVEAALDHIEKLLKQWRKRGRDGEAAELQAQLTEVALLGKRFDPRQPRDEHGRWVDVSGPLGLGGGLLAGRRKPRGIGRPARGQRELEEVAGFWQGDDYRESVDTPARPPPDPPVMAAPTEATREPIRPGLGPPARGQQQAQEHAEWFKDPEGWAGEAGHELRVEKPMTEQLTEQWADLDRELLPYAGQPHDPEAQRIVRQQKDVTRLMHHYRMAERGTPTRAREIAGPRDVVIVGAGPAGLSAAIYGATEGLDTLLISADREPGGQSEMSSRIENVMGFPVGISGAQLAAESFEQAKRVGASTVLGVKVTGIEHDRSDGTKVLTLSNGTRVRAKTVVLAGGVQARKLPIENGDETPDIVYGDSRHLKAQVRGREAFVVGGGNSAGQAAIDTAREASHVTIMLRKGELSDSMSQYLVDQIASDPKIDVRIGELAKANLDSRNRLNSVTLKDGTQLPAGAVGVFIGFAPDTSWLGDIQRSTDGSVLTGTGNRHQLETNMPGVYAAGDVRDGSIHRVISAAADGAAAIHGAHGYLDVIGEHEHEDAGDVAERLSLVEMMRRARGKAASEDALARANALYEDDEADRYMDKLWRFDMDRPFTEYDPTEAELAQRVRGLLS